MTNNLDRTNFFDISIIEILDHFVVNFYKKNTEDDTVDISFLE